MNTRINMGMCTVYTHMHINYICTFDIIHYAILFAFILSTA